MFNLKTEFMKTMSLSDFMYNARSFKNFSFWEIRIVDGDFVSVKNHQNRLIGLFSKSYFQKCHKRVFGVTYKF